MDRLKGKVALICGCSPNNGGTTAHFMAREGALIAANDIVPEVANDSVQFLRSKGYEAVAVPGDVSDPEAAQAIVDQTVSHFGHVDILVNMAGIQYRWPVLDIDYEEWNKLIAGFLTSAMLTTKYAGQAMVATERRGSIIHLASDMGQQGVPSNPGYSAVKAGIINFCRAAAADLAQYGIRVNTISPTAMEHNQWLQSRDSWKLPRTRNTMDFLGGIPVGRLCRSSDVAWAAVFLASEEASFMTGQDISLDGGARSKYWAWSPGANEDVSLEEYVKNVTPTKYGEPVTWEEIGWDPRKS